MDRRDFFSRILSAIGLAPILGLAAVVKEEEPTVVVASQWEISDNELTHVAYSNGKTWVSTGNTFSNDSFSYCCWINSSNGQTWWLLPGTHKLSGEPRLIALDGTKNGNP